MPQRTAISVNKIKEGYHVSHGTAQPIIEQLIERGLIGPYSAALKGHPVRVINLKSRTERERGREDEAVEEERSQTS